MTKFGKLRGMTKRAWLRSTAAAVLITLGTVAAGSAASARETQADSSFPKAPSPNPPAGPRAAGQSQAYVKGDGWWANNWCHYYTDSGVTYGDLCLTRVVSKSDGKLMPDRYNLYQYDPNIAQNRGKLVMSLYTGKPGWAYYRDWTDPRLQNFPDVVWLQHPANDSDVNANNFFVHMRNGSRYSVAQITALAGKTGSGGGTGSPSGGSGGGVGRPPGLPAWDPAFSGPNQLALKLIHNVETGRSNGGTGSPLTPSLGNPSTGTPKNN